MSNTNMDKSLFFITLSLVCIWIVVDMAVGEKYLTNFLETLFPFMKDGGGNTLSYDTEGLSTGTVEEAPLSSAAGSNNSHGKWVTDEDGEKVWVPSESASQSWNNAVTGNAMHGVRSE